MAHRKHLAPVGKLISALQRYDLTTPVRSAPQPGYPFDNTIGQVVCTPPATHRRLPAGS